MAALTTVQLRCMLDSIITCGTQVLGVFPADCVPIKLVSGPDGKHILYSTDMQRVDACYDYCFVLNTDPADKPGEHWLAFYYSQDGGLEYFDSFGLQLHVYEHVYAALRSAGFMDWNTVNTFGILQSPISTICGHYCVVFLRWRAKHPTVAVHTFCLHLLAMHPTAKSRDKHIVAVVHQLLSSNSSTSCCSSHMLGHDTCLQSCTCRSSASWRI